jgi:hypothetical protein
VGGVARAVALVPVAVILAAPASSGAQEIPTADLEVTLTVCDGRVLPLEVWTCETPADPSADVLIGEDRTLIYVVRNTGPSPTTAKLTFRLPRDTDLWRPVWQEWLTYPNTWVDLTYGQDEKYTYGYAETYLGPGWSFNLKIGLTANAPGDGTIPAAVSGTDILDLNPSNDSATWETNVVCSITGTSGDDILRGTDDFDSICGGHGNDHLTAVGMDDKLFGQAGNDLFDGAGGEVSTALAVGGKGFDTASYANADRPITLCRESELYSVVVSLWAPNRLVEIEEFIGSAYGDLMEGTSDDDVLVGGGGNDRIVGRAGEDVLRAGPGRDRILTRDAATDLIRGGAGYDRARTDRRDEVVSAHRVATRPFVSPCDA